MSERGVGERERREREREEGEEKVPLPQIALDFRAKSNNSLIIINHKLVIMIAKHTQRRKGYRSNCKEKVGVVTCHKETVCGLPEDS